MSDLDLNSNPSDTNKTDVPSFSQKTPEAPAEKAKDYIFTQIDRDLVIATQEGLPIVERPYQVIADQLGISEDEVMFRLEKMKDCGVIRRIAGVPNHYRIGFKANGMTVWNVADDQIKELGRKVGQLPFVSHCYQRPRHQPYWNYNLFAMVHGSERAQVEERAQLVKELLGNACTEHEILYSSKILKKTGLRLAN